jgi:hypothetical protein
MSKKRANRQSEVMKPIIKSSGINVRIRVRGLGRSVGLGLGR